MELDCSIKGKERERYQFKKQLNRNSEFIFILRTKYKSLLLSQVREDTLAIVNTSYLDVLEILDTRFSDTKHVTRMKYITLVRNIIPINGFQIAYFKQKYLSTYSRTS